MSSKHDGRIYQCSNKSNCLFSVFFAAIEAQSKAIRDERRKEEDEARGTRFGQQILDTEVYEDDGRSSYLNYLPKGNDEDVSQ